MTPTVTVTCHNCHTCQRRHAHQCTVVHHPDETAWLSWSCAGCGPQANQVCPVTVGMLHQIGVHIVDWSMIVLDDPGWPAWSPLELVHARRIARSWWRPAGPMDRAIRRMIDDQR